MRVAVVGTLHPELPAELDQAYVRAFRAAGHEVVPVSWWARLRTGRGVRRLEARIRSDYDQPRLDREVRVANPDLVVVIKGHGLRARTVEGWRRAGLRVANVFPDNPFEQMAQGSFGDEYHRQFRACHAVFVPDRFSAAQLREGGVVAEFLPFARDEAAHVVPEGRPAPDGPPLIFIGHPDAERLRYLRAVHDLGLRLYGPWHHVRLPPTDPLRACIAGGFVDGAKLVTTLRSARISINVFRSSQKTAHNMRTFETPACGVCCLSEASVGLEELMEAEREVALFDSPADLRRRAMELIGNPQECESIAVAGQQRVAGETYTKRARQIIEMVE